jgi:hypothetical protein
MPMSTKCQKNEKKSQLMSYNMMIGYDIYNRFAMEHFPLCQSMILTTSFFFFAGDSTIPEMESWPQPRPPLTFN